MTQSSEDDLWNLAFSGSSNFASEGDHLSGNSDDVARAIYTICEIGAAGHKLEGATGAW